MIVHLFPGDITHLSASLIRSVQTHSKLDHLFLVPVFDPENEKLYTRLSEENPSLKIQVFDSSYRTRSSVFLMFLLGHRGEKLIQEATIASILFKHKKEPIVSHFYFKSYALLPIFKMYTWVCWGNIPNTTFPLKRNRLKKLKFRYYTKYVLRSCKHIVTLMNPDKDKLVNTFKCKDANVSVIPYIANEFKDIPEYQLKEHGEQTTILLGNSLHLIDSYISILPHLKFYANETILYALMSYGNASKKDEETFLQTAKEIYGNNFVPVYEFIPAEKYNAWLNQFDIYLCNTQNQSGLGAIYRMINLGKRLFLNGYNYEWCKRNGIIVSHVSVLAEGNKDTLFPLSEDEKKQNRAMLNKLLDTETLTNNWDNFYLRISNAG